MTTPAIELRKINKRFGPVWANRDINLSIMPGTIHGIVGENGAGKSTLMSILYGFYSADSGEILVDGKPVKIRNSQQAIELGIGMVHQHFMLVETFTVLENIILGVEGKSILAGAIETARKELLRIATEHGLEVNPDSMTGELPVGMQQRVEILKALYRGARVLILDEPSGVLTPQETERLFKILGILKDNGVTIILITHKLREIMAACDSVSVMRAGELISTCNIANTSTEDLAERMVGRKVLLKVDKQPATPGDIRLEANNLGYTDDRGVARLKEISLTLRAGEILGVAGVSGNGQSALLEALSGTLTPQQGSIKFNTKAGQLTLQPKQYRDAAQLRHYNLAHIPEDRLRQGLVKELPAWENAILGYQHNPGIGKRLMSPARTQALTEKMMNTFDVRPALPHLKSANFSGGNQQKLIIAREMMREPDILLVGQPTRGVDIGAIEFIHQQLITARDNGAAILLVSVELEEILSLADRIIVMVDGRISGEVRSDNTNEQELGLLMANARKTTVPAETRHTKETEAVL